MSTYVSYLRRFPIQYLRYMRIAILLFRIGFETSLDTPVSKQFFFRMFAPIDLTYYFPHRAGVFATSNYNSIPTLVLESIERFAVNKHILQIFYKTRIRRDRYLLNDKINLLTLFGNKLDWTVTGKLEDILLITGWQRASLSLIFRTNCKVNGIDTSLIIIRLIYWPSIIVICYVKDVW